MLHSFRNLIWLCLVADEASSLLQTSSLLQRQLSLQAPGNHPWDKKIFFVGTHHKAGSRLIRNTMTHIFDILGATSSCSYGAPFPQAYVTSLNGQNDCNSYPAPIRLVYSLAPKQLLKIRRSGQELGANVKGVTTMRDPFDMVCSAYVYHHRGAEPKQTWNSIKVRLVGPEEGVPETARIMLPAIQGMAKVYEMREPDTLFVRYENFTHSSQEFDATVEQILDFLFKDEITEQQRKEAMIATRVEDLNRVGEAKARPEDPKINHTNDEDEMQIARAALPLIPADLYAEYMRLRKVLGYV